MHAPAHGHPMVSTPASSRGFLIGTHKYESGRLRSGRHVVVVAQRGPLLLVAVSSGGEPTSALRRRLDLLHGQVSAP